MLKGPMKGLLSEIHCGQELHLLPVCLVVFQVNSNRQNSRIQKSKIGYSFFVF